MLMLTRVLTRVLPVGATPRHLVHGRVQEAVDVNPLKETDVPEPDPVLRQPVARDEQQLRFDVLV